MNRRLVALLGVAAALAAACAGGGTEVSPAVFAPPTTTTTAAPAASGTPQTPPGCTAGSNGTVVESTRPPASLPAPGSMPPGTYMRQIQDRGHLVGGTSPDQLRFGFVNPLTGQVEGFDADLLKYVSAAIFGGDPNNQGGHLQIVTITLADRIPKIRDGSLDIVADTMTINCARRLQVDFTTEYYKAGQKVLVRKDSTFKQIQDLGGKKVCSAASSTSLDNLAAISTHPIGIGLPDQSDCLVAFQQGKVDAISTDDTVLAGLAAQDPYAIVVGDSFTDEPYGMAISLQHPEFTAFVNGVLEKMRADGSLQGLYVKWLGALIQPLPAIPPTRYKQ